MDQVLAILRATPQGLSNHALQQQIPDMPSKELGDIINKLLADSLIVLEATEIEPGKQIMILRAIDPEKASLMSSMDTDERLVFTHIEASSDHGIWTRDLEKNTNLHRKVLNKVLKSMEGKRIIKSVKSIRNPGKKIYMLYDIVPAVELTGGAFFTDQELDVEFVRHLSLIAIKHIRDNSPKLPPLMSVLNQFPTTSNVQKFISDTNISTTELAVSDVYQLLRMLEYDGQIERIDPSMPPNDTRWRIRPDAQKAVTSSLGESLDAAGVWTEMPCGQCTVFKTCSSRGSITPITCIYFKDWL